uniref:Uncharacterized protein n=1 Tax=viral metagenome TaxID=1070528 RepID=A0A6C0ANH2_9ZZZZ
MAYSDTFIRIHLVKDSTTTTLDDLVHIVKNLDDSVFEVTFKDNGDPLKHKAYQMTRDNVCDYVYLLLKNLSLDEDGYQKIQFSLPAMPRVIVDASKLNDVYYREHFLELIECGLTMLDKVEKLTIKNPSEKNTCDRRNSYCCRDNNTNMCNWSEIPKSPLHTYFE